MSTRITENYEQHTKDELLAECREREFPGIKDSDLKADIIAALELDDENKESKKNSRIPNAEVPQVTLPPERGGAPADDEFKGSYIAKEGNIEGEEFALAEHEPDTYGRTHTAKNSRHTWQGTKEEFRQTFEKK